MAVADVDDDACPKTFIDPISLGMMQDPVVTVDGQSYDRASIVGWFDSQEQQGITRFTAPLTGAVRVWLQICMIVVCSRCLVAVRLQEQSI
jgi:hypothetical protein